MKIRKKASAILFSFIIASLTMAPHLACAQTGTTAVPTVPSVSKVHMENMSGPITALTVPLDTAAATNAANSSTPMTVTGAVPASTAALVATSNATISAAQKAAMYTQTETQITVLQAQLNSLTTSASAATPTGKSQIASVTTSISNCQSRATILDPTKTTLVTGDMLNTYHCP